MMANPYVANGTCYAAAGQRADVAFAPCGNDALGHKPCCQLGDQCLSSNACYNGQFGTTYLAGCSDPDYEHESCPEKAPFDRQSWAGLVYCNGTSNEWVACRQQGNPKTLRKPDPCWCSEDEASRTIAFSASSVLEYVASMPTKSGGSVVFQAGHVPTQPPTTVTATDGNGDPTGTSTVTTPTPTSPAATTEVPPASGNGGMSSQATIGVAVGATIGGLFLVCTLIFLWLSHRRRIRRGPTPEPKPSTRSDVEGSPHPSELPVPAETESKAQGQSSPFSLTGDHHMSTGDASVLTSTAPSELGYNAARPWSMRSELQGSDTQLEKGVQGADGPDAKRHDYYKPLVPVAELPG